MIKIDQSYQRRAAGILLLLCAFIPFFYASITQIFLFDNYNINSYGIDVSCQVPFSLTTIRWTSMFSSMSLSIMSWCLQFVLPAFILGGRLLQTNKPMKQRNLIMLSIIAILGLLIIYFCAIYQYDYLEQISSLDKEQNLYPIIYCGVFNHPCIAFALANCIILAKLAISHGVDYREDCRKKYIGLMEYVALIIISLIAILVSSYWWSRFVAF